MFVAAFEQKCRDEINRGAMSAARHAQPNEFLRIQLLLALVVALALLLLDPKLLLKLADFVQVRANAVQHLSAFSENLFNIRVCGFGFRFRGRIH